MAAHTAAQVLPDLTALLNGQIGNAAVGIELIGRDESVRRTGLNAAGASAAAVRRRKIDG